MRFLEPLILSVSTEHSPASLMRHLARTPGAMLLTWHSGPSAMIEQPGQPPAWHQQPLTIVVGTPFLRLRSWGSRCHWIQPGRQSRRSTNPWEALNVCYSRYLQPHSIELPIPVGGCFGLWGYGLRTFLEPRLTRRATPDLPLPDCDLGFHDSLVLFGPAQGQVRIIATGLSPDGSRSAARARQQATRWRRRLESVPLPESPPPHPPTLGPGAHTRLQTTLSRSAYLDAVARAKCYIHAGDIYQVNLAQRLTTSAFNDPWSFFGDLQRLSPAPYSAFYQAGDFQLASASPELFLRLQQDRMITRPIKGTRPRHVDSARDAESGLELRTNPKEQAELLMITDLMRNDLGRVCEYGSVTVPDLMRLEGFAHVHHLVATIQGRLRAGISHPQALAACFPGGSVTGAPKLRAMDIIDELEPVARGPYTGALGALGFNQQSQWSMIIRTAIFHNQRVHFPVGAGIVADSDPQAEYDETLVKARAFLDLVNPTPQASLPGANAVCLPSNHENPRALS